MAEAGATAAPAAGVTDGDGDAAIVGLCAGCGRALEEFGIAREDAAAGAIYCGRCSAPPLEGLKALAAAAPPHRGAPATGGSEAGMPSSSSEEWEDADEGTPPARAGAAELDV
jgi:hypothetical protein